MPERIEVCKSVFTFDGNSNEKNMNNKILKGLVAAVMAAVAVIIAIILVNHIHMGLETSNDKLMLALYVAMLGYALFRMFGNIRDIFKKP